MMYLFSDPSDVDPLEEIEERANPSAISAAPSVLGAITLGAGAVVFPPAGLLAVAMLLDVFGKVKKRAKNQVFLRRNPHCLAHLIKSQDDLIYWLETFGEEAVRTQLETAIRENQPLTSVAKRLAQTLIEPTALKKKTIEASVAKLRDPDRLKDATPLNDSQAKLTTAVNSTKDQPPVTDMVDHWLKNLRCTFLGAPPRTGKGLLSVAMMGGLKHVYPKGKLYTCTIKQFAGEDWYWQFSDRHINPNTEDGADLVLAAKQIHAMYKEWYDSESSKEAPSVFFLDELRDTLERLEPVKMKQVDPNTSYPEKGFSDWLRKETISSATMNQCHGRFIVLIAPVSTATALGYDSADSLKAYSGYLLVTPEERGFAGSRGAFPVPNIEATDPRFEGWYGLAWSTRSQVWVGGPLIDSKVIEALEKNKPMSQSTQKLNTPNNGTQPRAAVPPSNNPPQDLFDSFRQWIDTNKIDNAVIEPEQVRSTHWAKVNNCRSIEQVNALIARSLEAGILTQTSHPERFRVKNS